MTYAYSEDVLIEQTAVKLFKEQLKWQTANVYYGEKFGPDGSIGRESEADVILKVRFLDVLKKFNPDLPTIAYESAFEIINSESATKSLAELNHEKYDYLKDGIPVTYKNDKGEIVRNKKLKVYDFEDPGNNDFLIVQQLWLEGKSKRRRRPDLVGFVNGVPLLFIELKAHHRKIKVAYDNNLKDYKDVIPKLFHSNAFIILSNGLQSKIGSITSKYGHFNDWKRIKEEEEGRVSLETIIRGVCEKSRFMDLFENFILFDESIGDVAKLIARNHQFLGVNKALAHFEKQNIDFAEGRINKEQKQQLGVFWHTQGSGKSYSMVFFCQKIHRKLSGSYTFLLVTDRVELDKQIYGTFEGVGAVKDKKAQAGSGKDLKKLLKTDKRYIFTLIHKFNFDEAITERDNVIVISDEAHRTQGGSLALNMRNSLPNASFMGITGTPLFKDDEMTKRIFGDYVSVYDFKRSVEDNATVPLYYENRGEKLMLDNPALNDEIRKAIEDTDLDQDQEEKLKQLFAREYPILTSEKRLRAIAKDIVYHFNNRGYKGKAMLVAIDKITAVKMYNFIMEEWALYVAEKERAIAKLDDVQEVMLQQRDLNWTKETEVAVVISSEQNEIDKFQKWDLDIEPHRLKMNSRDLEVEFKDENNPFRLAIVCAMWITGFDVQSLSTLYLDKPLRSHTLMQTIARANRVHEGKNNGLIVDYIETYKNLLEALAIYAIGGEKGTGGADGGEVPVRPIEELIEALEEAMKATEDFLSNEVDFELSEIIESEGLDKLAALEKGINAIYTTDETKNKYAVLAREVFKKFKALMPRPEINAYRERRDAIDALYQQIQENTEGADVSEVIYSIQKIVDASIESMPHVLERTKDYGKKIDISSLDFKLIEEKFLKTKNKNTEVQSLKAIIEQNLNRMLDSNPLRIDFYEKYQEIIDEYNQGKEAITIEETFDKLKAFVETLSEEDARAKREDLTENQLTIFDLLRKDKQLNTKDRNKVKAVATDLLEQLEEDELKVEFWVEKSQTKAAVKNTIHDMLFQELPYPIYAEKDIEEKTDLVFDYLRESYRMVG